jgi:hypothetical protein
MRQLPLLRLDDDVGKLPDDAVAALHGSAEL